jgi:hypothetical protein
MAISIPDSLFEKYNEGIDLTIDKFGVNCRLVNMQKIQETVYNPNNNVPDRNSINAHRVRGGDYERSNVIIKEVETYTTIKLKVYWDPKNWVGVGGNLNIPDGSIQTVGFLSDLPKILQAKALIVHDNIKDYKELRFERVGEHIPMGFKQNRYFACMWKRTS